MITKTFGFLKPDAVCRGLGEEIYENKVLTHCDHSFEKFWVKLRDIEYV